MYENLLSLPYLQGMSKDDITAILDKVKLEFQCHGEGNTICNKGDECNKFIILTKGAITSTATAPDGSYTIEEEHKAPHAIEPYSMFGYPTIYTHNYTSKGDSTTLVIDKSYFFSEFTKQNIFTLNFMNLVSRRAQIQSSIAWNHTPTSIEGRIIMFIAQRCETTTGSKKVKIKMERLAGILCETRLNVSKALNSLQECELITLSRKEIHIPDFSKLMPLIK